MCGTSTLPTSDFLLYMICVHPRTPWLKMFDLDQAEADVGIEVDLDCWLFFCTVSMFLKRNNKGALWGWN